MVAQVQNSGLAKITALLQASAFWLQWGTGSAAAKSATTVTTTTTTEARVAGTLTQQTTTVTNDALQIAGTITAAGTRAITELGSFDTAGSGSPPTGGLMDFYNDFSVINLLNADSIAFTQKITFA
jgi:hypothetical protein